MERHDRGGASTPTNNMRNIEGNSSGRRAVLHAAAMSNGHSPPPPVPNLRKVASSSNLSASAPMPAAQIINLSREAMRHALENEKPVPEASTAVTGVNTGVTVDLSRKNIKQLPEEVVDIVNNGLER